jgi:iron complex transport system ATP-binding protein
LKSEQTNNELTIVVVTHDINLAAQFCDRLILLHQGRILSDGVPNDVLQFKLLQDVFGVNVYIDINPLTNSIYVLPYAGKK